MTKIYFRVCTCEWRHQFWCRLGCCCGSKQTHTGDYTHFSFDYLSVFRCCHIVKGKYVVFKSYDMQKTRVWLINLYISCRYASEYARPRLCSWRLKSKETKMSRFQTMTSCVWTESSGENRWKTVCSLALYLLFQVLCSILESFCWCWFKEKRSAMILTGKPMLQVSKMLARLNF